MVSISKDCHGIAAAATCRLAVVALLFGISSCANMDLRRDRISSGGLSETPEDKAASIPGAEGVASGDIGRFTLAASGDTITSIAGRFGIDAGDLARMNGKHPREPLRQGEVIVLPDGAATADKAGGERGNWPEPQKTELLRYRVQRGDTAFTIARSFGTSARIIAEWNDLGPGFEVREGQQLQIPIPHVLRAGSYADAGRNGGQRTQLGALDELPSQEPETELPPSPRLDQYRTEDEPALLIPVKGEILTRYTGTGGSEGIDIEALPGTSVRAADDGTVALVTNATDQTVILLLRHEGDLYTVYSNLEQTSLKQNDRVLRGQSVGRSAGGDPPFVHFEVRIGANSVDPESYL